MLVRPFPSLGFCLLVATGLYGQEKRPDDPPLTKAEKALLRAGPRKLPRKLKEFILSKMKSGLYYAGQYDLFRRMKTPATPWLRKWIETPPANVHYRDVFRSACMRALCDIHGRQPPEDLLTELQRIATEDDTPDQVRREATYALAILGDRRLIRQLIEKTKELTRKKLPRMRATGHTGLAEIHYRLREPKEAARHILQVIEIYRAGLIQHSGLRICHYNAACFLALAGEKDAAFQHLETALQTGKAFSREAIERDRDLFPLHGDPRFKKLLDTSFKRGASPPIERKKKKRLPKKKSRPKDWRKRPDKRRSRGTSATRPGCPSRATPPR